LQKGLPFAPWCSDRFGRRVTVFGGALLMLAGVGLQAAALSVALFIGARLLIGVGLVFCLNAAPLLITELAYPTQVSYNLNVQGCGSVDGA
jgi:MFS family permease